MNKSEYNNTYILESIFMCEKLKKKMSKNVAVLINNQGSMTNCTLTKKK